ncbi:efflux RND transporter periplasmic adaptor subunit [bacterium]|nr:efflux RND transporter periplasmic adaptor subunit [bacterium]
MSKRKKVIIWIIIVAVILGGVFLYFKTKKTEVERITEMVKVGEVIRTVSVTGEIIPEKQADLAFETGGRIKSINVEVGDKVEEGQIIATLDDSVVKSQLWGAQIALDIQQKNLDLSRRGWNDLKPEEKAAKKLAVDQARAGVQTIREQLGKMVLYSPLKGIVTERDAEPGEIAGIGATIISIIQKGEFKIEAEVSESDIAEVNLGQKANITFDALPSEEIFKAEVVEIEPAATIIQDVVYYKVELKLADIDQRFRAGMSADIDILAAQENSVLTIPERAVKSENGAKIVQVLLENGEVKKVEVKTGLRGDDGNIEIKSGLKEGDEVVVFVK